MDNTSVRSINTYQNPYRTLFYVYAFFAVIMFFLLTNTYISAGVVNVSKYIGLTSSNGYFTIGGAAYSGYYTLGSGTIDSTSVIHNYIGLGALVGIAPVLIFILFLVGGFYLNINGIKGLREGNSKSLMIIIAGLVLFGIALFMFPVILQAIDNILNM